MTVLVVVATVVFAVLSLLLWREALVAHRLRDDDNAGVFVAVGALFAWGALAVSGIAGL